MSSLYNCQWSLFSTQNHGINLLYRSFIYLFCPCLGYLFNHFSILYMAMSVAFGASCHCKWMVKVKINRKTGYSITFAVTSGVMCRFLAISQNLVTNYLIVVHLHVWSLPRPHPPKKPNKINGLKLIRKEGNVLFNDALNTFYLRLYGFRHMFKDHSDSEKGNPLPPQATLSN